MPDRKQALIALRDKVKAGEFDGAPMRFDAFRYAAEPALDCLPAVSQSMYNRGLAWSAYKGSLDADHELHKVMLPGWSWECRVSGFGGAQACVWNPMVQPHPGYDFRSESQVPSRAWLLAILEALIAEADK